MSPYPPSMITQQQVLDRFRRLFVCRDDCYHRYDDGGKKWERINDGTDRVVSWEKGGDLSSLAGKPVRLRFVMRDSDLYAVRFRY